MHDFIPIIAIVLGITAPTILFLALFYLLYRNSRNKHEERLELIKSGKDLPIEIYKSYKKRKLYWGLIFSAVGGGIFIMGIIEVIRKIVTDRAYAIRGDDFWGLVPLLIGVALIVFYKFFEKENGNGKTDIKTGTEVKTEE